MNSKIELVLSPLPKTWIFDLDGTLVEQNGIYHEGDNLLPGVKNFFTKIKTEDCIIILTARPINLKDKTEDFLKKNGIQYN